MGHQQHQPQPPLKPLGQPITENEAAIVLLKSGYSIDQVHEFLRRVRV